MSAKYPRKLHLPWSEGLSDDDRRIESVASLIGVEIVITEKADGSNVCLEHSAVFARSHNDAPRHPSFDALKARHAAIQSLIPDTYQIFAEWLWARHSIAYDRLLDHLLVFGIRDIERNMWLSWEETEKECTRIGLMTVPVLWRGTVRTENDLRRQTEALINERCLGVEQEGLVVRVSASFADADFARSVAKWVRTDHVQTGDHWNTQQIQRNRLAG